MEHLDPLPVNPRKTGEGPRTQTERRKWPRSGEPSSFLYGLAQDGSGLFGRNLGHFALVVEALDHHWIAPEVRFSQEQISAFCSATLANARHSSTEGTRLQSWDVDVPAGQRPK